MERSTYPRHCADHDPATTHAVAWAPFTGQPASASRAAHPSSELEPPWGTPPQAEAPAPITRTEPWVDLPYHRLAHVTPSSARWWRPLVVLLTFVLSTVLVALLALGVVWGALATFPEIPSPSKTLEDPRNPVDVAYSFGALALFLPVVWLTMRIASGRLGTINSVLGRLRWPLLRRALAVVLPLYAVLNAATFFTDRPDDFSVPPVDARLLAIIVIAILVVPLQAAAEEYVFRGLIPQMIGTWLRSPLWGVLVSVPLFVWGHGYDAWGLVDIAAFALCASYLAWKTGGLELPIVMHVANNLTLTLLAPFSPSSMHQGAVEPASLLLSVPMTVAVTVGLSWYVSREYGLRRFEPVLRSREVQAV